MAVNNWHVASKVRRMGFWTDIPLIGTFFGAHLSTNQVKVGLSGVVVIAAVLSQYPSSDWIGKIITGILLSILTIYFCLKEPENYGPEKIKFQTFFNQLFKMSEAKHYRPLSTKDLEGYKKIKEER